MSAAFRNAGKAASAVAFERATSLVSKGVEVAMFATLVTVAEFIGTVPGIIACFAVGWILSLPIFVFTIQVHIRTSEAGFDVTGVQYIREWFWSPVPAKPNGHAPGKLWRMILRRVKWLLRNPITSYILLVGIGSVFYIEEDYVTCLLRKEGESFWSVVRRVGLLSLTWSVAAWTGIYLAAYLGLKWATNII